VFGVLAERLADLMALAEAVGFRRLDPRLAAKRLGHGEVRHATHRALGDEPGSVREIASRAGCAASRAPAGSASAASASSCAAAPRRRRPHADVTEITDRLAAATHTVPMPAPDAG
jgi:hypothetical protein